METPILSTNENFSFAPLSSLLRNSEKDSLNLNTNLVEYPAGTHRRRRRRPHLPPDRAGSRQVSEHSAHGNGATDRSGGRRGRRPGR